jgi:hypothetical protein
MKWEDNHAAVNTKNLGAGAHVLFEDCALLLSYLRKTAKGHEGLLRSRD